MSLPRPELGLVVCYEFLWADEHDRGDEEGDKRRPTVIMLKRISEEDDLFVTVAPFTRSEAREGDVALPIPPKVIAHLNLDTTRPSWIIVSEVNEFKWPGPDLYRIPKGRQGDVAYGFIPVPLYDRIIGAYLALADNKRRVIPRRE